MRIQNETLSGIKKYLGWFYGDVLQIPDTLCLVIIFHIW